MEAKANFSLHILFFLFLTGTAVVSQSNIVETLPGYPGPLPFQLETGYIGVGENEQVQLFYYFVESERDPDKDPVLFWLTGGPGCTGFSGFVMEIGPLRYNISSYNGSLPSLALNTHSWTKIANIIFIDSPVGTGFSYAKTPEAYPTSDTKSSMDNYMFLRKWLLNHPSFIKNRMYVAGDSYGGKIVPMVAFEIARGNKAGLEPWIHLQGYLVGNSVTDVAKDDNERVPYAHRMALISDEYFELAKSSCKGEYVNLDPSNTLCLYALSLIEVCTNKVSKGRILYPNCNLLSPEVDGLIRDRAMLEDDPDKFHFPSKELLPLCSTNLNSNVWANDQSVQRALHVRKGTIKEWVRCNHSLSYERDVPSVFQHHRILNEEGYQILAYSGDHDMIVPYMSTLKWIRALNLTVDELWRPWTVDGQVAGYTMKYKNKEGYITFATIKGGSHTPPEDMPKECFALVRYRYIIVLLSFFFFTSRVQSSMYKM